MLISLLKKLFSCQSDRQNSQRHSFQVFILEPILTPSGILPVGEDGIDIVGDETDFSEAQDIGFPVLEATDIDFDEFEEIPFFNSLSLPQVNEQFDSGVFTVGDSGEVTIDFLFDGGKFKGELAIFSLENMDEFEPGSREFIQEASDRALSNSEQGYVVISDKTEGARFSGELGEKSWNSGKYLGEKTFQMREGDEFGVMFVPNGTVEKISENPDANGSLRPLFSLSTANPDDSLQMGQIADVTGDGSTFVLEDMRIDEGSDRDYNDFIFRVKGATGEAIDLDDAIDPDLDWRETELGQEIINSGIATNSAPESLELASHQFYTAEDTVKISGSVYDTDGASDIAKVEFWLQQDNGEWQEIAGNDRFVLESQNQATFNYELSDLEIGRYQLKAIAYDEAGTSSNTFSQDFTVLSIDKLDNSVKLAIERAVNLDNYDPDALAATQEWVVSVGGDFSPETLAEQIGAESLGGTNHLGNTYVWEFAENQDTSAIAQNLSSLTGVEYFYPLVSNRYELRSLPNDTPLWHLHNTSQNIGTLGEDVNVLPVWQQGIEGEGVTIGIVDDGLAYNHADLQTNYREDLSRDFQETTGDGVYDTDPAHEGNEWHGTAVAGVAAGNGTGFKGVAPEASLAGLRLSPSSGATDLQVADALSYLHDDIDIYNNSWGPRDNGQFLGAPRPLSAMELHVGATQGRNGLGNIYVWAGGNGQQNGDNVNYDGYASSRYTIGVAAIDADGKQSYYSEPGASLLVSAYSSNETVGITTTSPTGHTANFGGTSAAAPIVSGVVALMLEVNPELTWREIQHILVETAKKNDPTDDDWTTNGAGHDINHKYGFGAIDAAAAVNVARYWQGSKKLDPEVQISSEFKVVNIDIPDNETQEVTSTITLDEDIIIESVEVMFDADHEYRGDLEVVLVSPDGTESILAEKHNDPGDDYPKWLFTSNRHWGESSKGDWTLRVSDKKGGDIGDWNSWKLDVYGTKPRVDIKTTDSYGKEGRDNAELTISRTGTTRNPLEVDIKTYSQAIAGQDYQALPEYITIPVGQSEVKIPIIPIDDTETESREYLRINIEDNDAYTIAQPSRPYSYAYILDNETPVISVNRGQDVWEYENSTYFQVQRLGDLESDIDFNYNLGGTATQDTDYSLGSLNWNKFYNYSYLYLKPTNDTDVEGDETVELNLLSGSGYTLGNTTSKSLTIKDDDSKNLVSIASAKTTLTEGEQSTLTITRQGNLNDPLTVHYTIQGAAENGTDYQSIENSVTIPKDSSSVTIPINLIDDTEVEGKEIVALKITPHDDYNIEEDKERAGLYIEDNDDPVQWLKQLGTSNYDKANDLALDSNENLYITGRTAGDLASPNSGSYDAFLAKYNPDGTEQWRSQLGGSGYDSGNSVAVDGANNVYISGLTDSFNGGDRDGFIAKYGSDGTLQWQKVLGSSSNGSSAGYDDINAMTVDDLGNVYMTGYTYSDLAGINQGEADAFVSKFNPNGELLWTSQLGTKNWDEANSITVDGNGNVYISGNTEGKDVGGSNQEFSEVFLAKYDKDGNSIWKQTETSDSWEAKNWNNYRMNDYWEWGEKDSQIFVDENTGRVSVSSMLSVFNQTDGSKTGSMWRHLYGVPQIPTVYNHYNYISRHNANVDTPYPLFNGAVLGNHPFAEQFARSSVKHLIDAPANIAIGNSGVYTVGTTDRTFDKYGQTNAGTEDIWLAKLDPSTPFYKA